MATTLRPGDGRARRGGAIRGAAGGSARRVGATLLVALSAACAHAPPREEPAARAAAEVGIASFYGHEFQGRTTASGARYDEHALTCAHPTARFGTRLRVTDLETGRSVVVTVNDRGPFAPGRVIDLSLAAARKLGIVRRGLARVRVERTD